MKTLIFCGSPRKNGDTMALISEYIKHINGEYEIIQSYNDNISACTDCRYCMKNEGCVIEDDMNRIYDLTSQADVIVLASPIHYSMVSGKLLELFSRYQAWYCNGRFLKLAINNKEKKGVILLAGGGDGSPEPALAESKLLLRSINVKGDILFALSDNTDEVAARDDEAAMALVKKIADNIYR